MPTQSSAPHYTALGLDSVHTSPCLLAQFQNTAFIAYHQSHMPGPYSKHKEE